MVVSFKKSLALVLSLLFVSSSLYATPTSHITLLLDWYINSNHAPILLAQSQGYFAKHQLNVDIIEPSEPSNDGAKLVAMKKFDLAITYQPHYRRQIKQGLPVKQIGTLIPTPLTCLVYLANSGINSPQDLKGKRIGYSDASDEFVLLKKVLQTGGLTLGDVKMVNVHFGLTQALMMKQIDVATGMMRNVQPIEMEERGFSPKMFLPEDFGISPYSELIYIAHSGPLKPEITEFLQAVTEATHYIQQNPEIAWKSVIKNYPQLNTPTNHKIWEETIPLLAKNPKSLQQVTA